MAKEKPDEDLKKALWYLQREYDRRTGKLWTTTQSNFCRQFEKMDNETHYKELDKSKKES